MSSGSKQESERLRSVGRFSDSESFDSQYVFLETIGHGFHATVKLALHRLTGTPVAVKILLKRLHWCYPVMPEVDIMMRMNHPNIVSLVQVIETSKKVYVIMELAEGKQLICHIQEAGPLLENEARGIFRQLLSAVGYCHDQGIVHRDLKPDNIMIDTKGRIKILDFGLSTKVQPGQKLRNQCGTYAFSAPELLLGKLYDGPKVDVWSLGVVLYLMTVGRLPFPAPDVQQLRKQVLLGKYAVPTGMSKDLRNLFSLLFSMNPQHRPTIAELLNHPWLKTDSEGFPQHSEEPIPLRPDANVLKAMEAIGFKAQDVKESLYQKKFNQTMACYRLLEKQALQECDKPTRPQPMNPWMAPFPSVDDPASFLKGFRRGGSEPRRLGSSSNSQGSPFGQNPSHGIVKRASWHGELLCSPLQTIPTLDLTHRISRSVPCIYPVHSRGKKNSNIKSTEDISSASAEGKPVPSRAWPKRFRGWAKNIRNGLMQLCCCIPSRRRPRLGHNRVVPQK